MSPRRFEEEPLGCSEREIVGVFVRENMMTFVRQGVVGHEGVERRWRWWSMTLWGWVVVVVCQCFKESLWTEKG